MAKTLNIAVFGDVSQHRINGFANSLQNLTHGLIGLGNSVDIFSTSIKADGIIQYLGEIPLHRYTSVNMKSYDIAILAGCFDYRLWRVAFWCKLHRIPYVVSPRSSLMRNAWKTSSLKKWLSFPILKFFYFSGKVAIHYLSEEERKNSWSFFQKSSFCVPNGISLPYERGIDKKRKVIGYLGRLDIRHKGLDTFVEAIQLCSKVLRKENFTVEIVGPNHRGGLEILNNLISRYRIEDIVSIFPPKRGSDKLEWLKDVAIFVHPSRYEGQPQAVFEAMAHYAVPIISPECNMVADVNTFGAGYVVEGTPLPLSEVIICAIQSHTIPDRMHVRRFVERYDLNLVAHEMQSSLLKFISGAG